MVKPFGDFGKTAKKLLGDDYVAGKKVEVKTTTDVGVAFTALGLESGKDGTLGGELSWKYKLYGASLTTKVSMANVISTEVVMSNLGVKGLKATVTGALASGLHSGTAKVDFVMDPAAVQVSGDINKKTITSALALGYKQFGIGATGAFKPETKSVEAYTIAADVTHKDSEITLTASDKLKTFTVAFAQTLSPTFAVAAEASYNREGKTMSMVSGIKYNVRANTLKMKADDKGLVHLAYVAAIDPNTTLIMTSSTKLKELNQGQKFGIALTFTQP